MDTLYHSSRLRRCAAAALFTAALTACQGLFPERPTTSALEADPLGVARTAQDLAQLRTVDLHAEVDGTTLVSQVQAALSRAAATGVDLTEPRVTLTDGAVRVTAEVADPRAGSRQARLEGRLEFGFQDHALTWHVRFDRAAVGTVRREWLDAFNDALHAALDDGGVNRIPLIPSPLARLSARARMDQPLALTTQGQAPLDGIYVLAGLAWLVDGERLRFALDLAFVPSIADCAPSVNLSRNVFAQAIEAREPVQPARLPRQPEDVRHFFTEIGGARAPLTVVHWWFADGQPVAVEELPVEPSARWRTWSSNTVDDPEPRNWNVLVFEKDSGCLLTIAGARLDADPDLDDVDPRQVLAAFDRATDALQPSGAGPVRAAMSASFVREVLSQALRDAQLDLSFDPASAPARQLSGHLAPLDASRVDCGTAQCESSQQCVAELGQCVRQRDNRDCGTCLFRNPLNNRCVNEGEDPVCVASRQTRNARFEREREACIAEQEAARMSCEQRQRREMESCHIEAAAERNACEAAREFLAGYDRRQPFAALTGVANASGRLELVFSEMSLREGGERIEARLALRADLDLDGRLGFEPEGDLGPLQSCISGWQGTFSSRAVTPRRSHRLVVPLAADGLGYVSEWPGFVANGRVNPSPLESALASDPEMLSDCRIKLTAREVARAVAGDSVSLFDGEMEFRVQPGPLRIEFRGSEFGPDGGLRFSP